MIGTKNSNWGTWHFLRIQWAHGVYGEAGAMPAEWLSKRYEMRLDTAQRYLEEMERELPLQRILDEGMEWPPVELNRDGGCYC